MLLALGGREPPGTASLPQPADKSEQTVARGLGWASQKLGDCYPPGAQIAPRGPFIFDIDGPGLGISAQIIPRLTVVALLAMEEPFQQNRPAA